MAPHVAAEFPGLGIAWIEVDGRPGKSPDAGPPPPPRALRPLLGAHAIHMRQRPIPWAYRVFFRQIGLDPDRTRTPVEQLALERLHDGAFISQDLLDDALTIAIVETGVALRAFDADRLEGRLCIRDSAPGESLAGRPGELAAGDAGDRRRARARSRCCSARAPRAAGWAATPAALRSSPCRSRACPRSRSRRRSGCRGGDTLPEAA